MYCIYLRKSRSDLEAELHGEGETLARHQKILLDLSKKLNINIDKIYKEVVSGETIAARPVMQELLSDVEKRMYKGVLVVELERLARGDTMDQGLVAQTFKYSDTKIITPMKTYDPGNEFDEEYFEFGLFMSRREYKTINRRLQRGRLESVKEGKYLGNIPPYGYIRKKLEHDKGYTLEPHPEQSNIVQLIFSLYTKGDSDNKRLGTSLIANKLNELKIPTAKKGVWTPHTIRGILANPVYIGKIRWNSRPQKKRMVDGKMIKERPRNKDVVIVEGLHPALIDVDTFNHAQTYLSKNTTTRVPHNKNLKNPLAGIITCGFCGRNMVRRPYGNNYPDGLICNVPSCKNISSHLHLVEEKLLDSLEIWLENYKIKLNNINNEENNNDIQTDVIKKSIEKLDIEIETLQKQQSTLHDLLEQGVYTAETFIERSKLLNEKIKSTENDRNALIENLSPSENKIDSKKLLIPKIEKVLKVYNTLEDPASKNNLLKEVLNKVVYIKTVNGRWHGKPDDFNLKLHPKLPNKI